jgi:metal-dependent amidase/aminoacylase/carboxypeptidase family protein
MLQVIEGTAKLHGCNASVVWSDIPYGPTVNAAPLVSLVEAAAGRLGVSAAGQPRWQRLAEPTMGAEDFSFLAGAAQPPLPTACTG